MLLSSSG